MITQSLLAFCLESNRQYAGNARVQRAELMGNTAAANCKGGKRGTGMWH